MIFPISLYSLEKLSTPGSDLWWTLNMCIFYANPLFYKTQTNGKKKKKITSSWIFKSSFYFATDESE